MAAADSQDAFLFAPPTLIQVQLGPDGQQVAGLGRGATSPLLLWNPAARSTPQMRTPGPCTALGWTGDGHLVVAEPQAGSIRWGVLAPAEEAPPRWPAPPPDGIGTRLLNPLSGWSGGFLLEGDFPGSGTRTRSRRGGPVWPDVLRISAADGSSQPAVENPGDTVEWLADAAGQVRVGLAIRGITQELRVRSPSDAARWRTVLTFDFVSDPAHLLALSPDGGRAWFAARLGRDTRGVQELDVSTGRVVRNRFADPEFDFDAAGRAVMSAGTLRALTWDADVPRTTWLGTPTGPEPRAGGTPVHFDASGRYGLFHERTDRGWGGWHWWDAERGMGRRLEAPDREPASEPGSVSPMEPVEWIARDGLRIRGYFTRPTGHRAGLPRLLVLVHGGPWERDRWGWQPEVQFLARRGWAVLQVNYRGSAGFGWTFQQAGAGQWVRAADDLVDGARWVVSRGWAGDRGATVAGASFGGFLSVLALTRPDNPFVAAVSIGGAFDLKEWLRDVRRKEPSFHFRAQAALLLGSGTPDRDSLRVPADHVRVPVLLLHAPDDARVAFSQSARLESWLRSRGRPVVLEPLSEGGHAPGPPARQAAMWSRVDTFLRTVSEQSR